MKKKREHAEIEARIDDLERYCSHLHTVLAGILESLPAPVRSSYALLALAYGFSAMEEDALDEFLRWAHQEVRAGRLTREKLIAEYEERMPERMQGKLEQILRAYEADGVHPDCVRVMFEQEA